MSHIGRPYDKKSKSINISEDDSVDAVVAYLQSKMRIPFVVPKFRTTEKDGIVDIDTSNNWLVKDLKSRKIGGIYLLRYACLYPLILQNYITVDWDFSNRKRKILADRLFNVSIARRDCLTHPVMEEISHQCCLTHSEKGNSGQW
ncbi:hypothetical protein SUGI_0257770 [Cryptomeria japonica]|nr:hypothetical protein SUGI_0257770 [Cryptomeria japonica]